MTPRSSPSFDSETMPYPYRDTYRVWARVISIGDELIRSRTMNSNGTELSAQLETLGVGVRKIVSLGDREEDIVEEIATHLRSQESILILTGGLGPTQDDRTVAAVARALQVKKITDPDHLSYLKNIRRTRNLPESFLKQAIVPQGFTVKRSSFGTAPFLYRLNKSAPSSKETKNRLPHLLILLPGVPYECFSLFTHQVIPLLKKYFPKLIRRGHFQELKIISVPESKVEEGMERIRRDLWGEGYDGNDGMEVAFLPSLGELLIRLRGDDPDYLKKVGNKLRAVFPDHSSYIAPINTPILSVAERLHNFFISKKWRVGFVESCTGGLLTSQMVSFPGSSNYLDSGVVTYSNQAKVDLCGVSVKTLKRHGAVSAKTAEEMAVGLAQRRKLDLAVSITGIAGPGNVSRNKPVGLVYIGLYGSCLPHPLRHSQKNLPIVITREFFFSEKGGKSYGILSRDRIRERAVKHALFLMMEVCFPPESVDRVF